MVKKIDFHIHTLPKSNNKDEQFDFSLEWLKKYLKEAKLDAIAITNHNSFSRENFKLINTEVSSVRVFPGMELDLVYGHTNLVYPNEEKYLDELENASEQMKSFEKDSKLTIKDFLKYFPSYIDSIMIFETGKSKSMRVPKELSGVTAVGGVSNSLKFQKVWQDNHIVPVLFSDSHATENGRDTSRSDINRLIGKNTFLQVDDTLFKHIKNALSSRDNVNIFKNNVHSTFTVNGLQVSNGLNLIIGHRGSGKTHFLDTIEKEYPEDIYRISQFESTKQDDFLKHEQSERENHALETWCDQNSLKINEIKDYVNSSQLKSVSVSDYLKELNQYATDFVKSKSKSKIKLFSQSNFDIAKLDWIEEILRSIKKIWSSNQLWAYIDNSQLYKNNLCNLYSAIRGKYLNQRKLQSIYIAVNESLTSIKDFVSHQTGQRTLPEFDFLTRMRRIVQEEKINEWMSSFQPQDIANKNLLGYKIITTIAPYKSASEFKDITKTNVAVADIIDKYKKKEFTDYLIALSEKNLFVPKDIVNYLFYRKTKILNENGMEASGGQAVALALTLSLEDSTSKDIILIDEPEASLDNDFIKNKLVPTIKKLGKEKAVFVVTHNSTLGSMLLPDYLILTKCEQKKFEIFSGDYSSKELTNLVGKKYNSFDSFLDAMEAGEDAFSEKKEHYEYLRNQ